MEAKYIVVPILGCVVWCVIVIATLAEEYSYPFSKKARIVLFIGAVLFFSTYILAIPDEIFGLGHELLPTLISLFASGSFTMIWDTVRRAQIEREEEANKKRQLNNERREDQRRIERYRKEELEIERRRELENQCQEEAAKRYVEISRKKAREFMQDCLTNQRKTYIDYTDQGMGYDFEYWSWNGYDNDAREYAIVIVCVQNRRACLTSNEFEKARLLKDKLVLFVFEETGTDNNGYEPRLQCSYIRSPLNYLSFSYCEKDDRYYVNDFYSKKYLMKNI